MKTKFQSTLIELHHKECWSIVAGEGTGSIFTLGLGRKMPRENPINNPNLTNEQRENDSEYGLMVYSSWKLRKEEKIVCDSNTDNSNVGSMVQGLARLRGKKIKETNFETFDQGISFLFDDGYQLQIACDGKELYGDKSDAFIIFTPTKNLSVTTDHKIEIEQCV